MFNLKLTKRSFYETSTLTTPNRFSILSSGTTHVFAHGLLPTLCPKQPKQHRSLPSTAFLIITAIRLVPVSSINTILSWNIIFRLPTVNLIWGYSFAVSWLPICLCHA